MEKKIALLRGDGIGPEIVDSAVRVLEAVALKYGHKFTFTPYLIGGCAIDACGEPLGIDSKWYNPQIYLIHRIW